jgi:DNA-binding transcriptional regulator YiaG
MTGREFEDITDEITTQIAAAAEDSVTGPVLTQYRNELRDADHSYALGLAQLRKAFELTQVTMAERLGTTQGNVAKIERRSDLLLSTLEHYISALGGEMRIIATFDGHEVEVGLGALEESSR